MSGVVKVLVLMLTGFMLGVGFNTWPVVDEAAFSIGGDILPSGLDPVSYGIGLFVGMMLWQIGSVPWAALPERFHKFLVEQMPFYRFVVMGTACLLVLIYF
ncbi:MAG: hypothetical protein JXQ99_08715 [Hyphomicrobiaceae bacterium]